METLAMTLGGIHGSLSDPVIWLMLAIVWWLAINKVSWWTPVGIAALFTAAQFAVNHNAYKMLGLSAAERIPWQFWLKLVMCLAVFGIIRLAASFVSRARSAV